MMKDERLYLVEYSQNGISTVEGTFSLEGSIKATASLIKRYVDRGNEITVKVRALNEK